MNNAWKLDLLFEPPYQSADLERVGHNPGGGRNSLNISDGNFLAMTINIENRTEIANPRQFGFRVGKINSPASAK